MSAFDPDGLPEPLRSLVLRALDDVDGCGPAIEALERHVERAGGHEARVALAVLLFEEAARLVFSQLVPAAERALALIDEAVRMGAPETDGLARLRRACGDALRDERSRERDLAVRVSFGRAEPHEIALLGCRRLQRGDDALALALFRRAAEVA